jgi:hypothetical protein
MTVPLVKYNPLESAIAVNNQTCRVLRRKAAGDRSDATLEFLS